MHEDRPLHARLTCDERSRYVPCPFIPARTPLSFREWSSRSATIPDGGHRSPGAELMRSRFMPLLTALVLAAGGSRLMAQETTGAVTGRITDPQGLAVPGATVTLTGPQGAKTIVTDGEGRFSAPLLVP